MKKRVSKIKIGFDKSHSKSMLNGMVGSLILKGTVETTETRAKALKSRIDRVMNLIRKYELDRERKAFEILRDKKASVKAVELLDGALKDRTYGLTTIYKTKRSPGDNSQLYRVSLVSYEVKDKSKTKKAVKKTETTDNKETTEGKGIIDRVRNMGKNTNKKGSQVNSGADKSNIKTRSGL